jgi:glycosyltransferase involved in cell wall biosynthesis
VSLLVYAPNVHQGGGRKLLLPLLSELSPDSTVILDERLAIGKWLPDGVRELRVRATVCARLRAEYVLRSLVGARDTVLCFGNLPPLFKLRGRVAVFLQNRYLTEKRSLKGFPLKTRIRIMMERIWFGAMVGHADELIVQTPTMRSVVQERVGNCVPVTIAPFVQDPDHYRRSLIRDEMEAKHNARFLYVASDEPHKNHRRLIEAWCLLAEENLFPSLYLTIDANTSGELYRWIDQRKAACGIKLEFKPALSGKALQKLYSEVDALIYPSTMESLGLPLIEARQAGLPILASELDYVRDVVDPDESFDPLSVRSIARAVMRFMGVELPALPLGTAADLLAHLDDLRATTDL